MIFSLLKKILQTIVILKRPGSTGKLELEIHPVFRDVLRELHVALGGRRFNYHLFQKALDGPEVMAERVPQKATICELHGALSIRRLNHHKTTVIATVKQSFHVHAPISLRYVDQIFCWFPICYYDE